MSAPVVNSSVREGGRRITRQIARGGSPAISARRHLSLPQQSRPCPSASASTSLQRPHRSSVARTVPLKSRNYAHSTTPPNPSVPSHLLSSTGITPEEFHTRRKRLIESLPEGSRVICFGGVVRLVTQRRKRSSTNFHYLTGFDEPDSVAVIESRPSTSKGYHYTLYVPPKDPHEEQWEGPRHGPEGAINLFNADSAYPNTFFGMHMDGFLGLGSSPGLEGAAQGEAEVYVELPQRGTNSLWGEGLDGFVASTGGGKGFWKEKGRRRGSSGALSKLFSGGGSSSGPSADPNFPTTILPTLTHLLTSSSSPTIRPLAPHVEKLRIIKSPAELALMKRAGDISSSAHVRIMRSVTKAMQEWDGRTASGNVWGEQGAGEGRWTEGMVEREFEWWCGMKGGDRMAYVPVVASGSNGLTIHYTRNTSPLSPSQTLLIDAGCEYKNYASDITRTFPVDGKFSAPQRDLYEAVLEVQKRGVEGCRVEDGVGMNELHRRSCAMLTEELKQIGFKLSTGDVERRLYPHYLSHHLGSDLHDCPSYERHAALVEGNVITIEPGVYVPFDDAFPKAFQGLAVRIEDAVAFTKDGPLNMSANAPKEVVDIEGVCTGALES